MSVKSDATHERHFAARWASGEWRGARLRSSAGWLTLLYEGHPGGPAGPDFRDAVLLWPDGRRTTGDIELHLRAGGWRAHRHHRDPAYEHVMLHVICLDDLPDELQLPRRADGGLVPVVHIPPAVAMPRFALPCQSWGRMLNGQRRNALLCAWGQARALARAEALIEHFKSTDHHDAAWIGSSQHFARKLWPAIAEALAYGRDREALHRAGELLVCGMRQDHITSYLETLPRVERTRGEALIVLFIRYGASGLWSAIRARADNADARKATLELTDLLHSAGVSPGRARIVIANVIVPFLLAEAATRQCATTQLQALAIYGSLRGLPSNQITRLLTRQLGLARQPTGAATQQGLHHLWATWCHEKRCDQCPCNVRVAD